jgi:hypothetical protein
MKPKYLVALALVLVGTNLFTYATARYWTTRHVLARARERVLAVQADEHAGVVHVGQDPDSSIQMAVNNAGGLYYWWNEGLIYWGAGSVLILSGLLVTKLNSHNKSTA